MTKRHWLYLLLIGSLAINLMVAGALSAKWLQERRPEPAMAWYTRDLPPATRQKLQPVFEEAKTTVAPLRRSLREQERDLREVLRREDVDPAELETALFVLQEASQAYQREMHRLALEVLPTLSPRERRMVMHQLMPDRGRPHRPQRPDRPPR
ncbi:MAG: periplasmic heavy metal sensor [Halieaceae bacterium]